MKKDGLTIAISLLQSEYTKACGKIIKTVITYDNLHIKCYFC